MSRGVACCHSISQSKIEVQTVLKLKCPDHIQYMCLVVMLQSIKICRLLLAINVQYKLSFRKDVGMNGWVNKRLLCVSCFLSTVNVGFFKSLPKAFPDLFFNSKNELSLILTKSFCSHNLLNLNRSSVRSENNFHKWKFLGGSDTLPIFC